MNNIKCILTIISLFILAACGGGGSSETVTPPGGTVIKGVASKGIITNGTVTVYALSVDGSKGAKLGTSSTDGSGAYNISIGSYTGPVIVEAFGNYTDEATGLLKSVPESAPLRAAIAQTGGTVSLSVTPLTDLAVRQAGALTSENITKANIQISDLFKVNIIATAPAEPTSGAFQSSSTTQAQRDYALVLAGVSQLMKAGGTELAATLSTLNSGISPAGMNSETAATLTTALNSFIANPKNLTGVTTIADTTLQNVGSMSMKMTIALQGSAAASVKGIQGTITLPSGVMLRTDAAGKILSGVMTMVSTASGFIEAKYTVTASNAPATVTLAFITTGNVMAGDILVFYFDLMPGVSAPATTAFTISNSKLLDADGTSVSGVSLVMSPGQ